MQKLIEFNENQDTPPYLPSHLDDLRHKAEYFEVPDLETQVTSQGNPHYWLQQDILQRKNFRYRFFHNIALNEDTTPQVKMFTHFLLKFFRFNYQLLWEQQDQQAYVNFPQILTETELLPYIIKNEHRHIQYRDLTSFNTAHIEQIHLDHNFLLEHSETSDSRPYLTTNLPPDTTRKEQLFNIPPQYTRQNTIQSEEDHTTHPFQSQESHQINPLYPKLPQPFDLHPSNPSETATTHNISELSDETVPTVQNTQSFTITNDSNILQVPTHNITQHETYNQEQDNTLNLTQDNSSVLSTSHTNITQKSQPQASPRQNYDPPAIPLQLSSQINTHNSPQQSSSNPQHTNTVQFQTPTPPSPPEIQNTTYTPAQRYPVQNVQTGLNIDTIHSNPPSTYTTSRNLSRPPLQPILTNPLSYNPTSTNSIHT